MAVGGSDPWLIHVVYCLLRLLRSVMTTYIKLKLASFFNKVCVSYAEPKLLLFIHKVHNGMSDSKITLKSFAVFGNNIQEIHFLARYTKFKFG